MNIFITGVDGFLGSNFAKFHLDKGDKVIGIDRKSVKNLQHYQNYLLTKNFSYLQMDLSQINDFKGLLKEIDLVYHFAAIVGVFEELKHPEELLKTNIEGTSHLLQAILKESPKAKVVLTSSSEVYGGRTGLCHEDDDIKLSMQMPHRLPYPLSKLINEVQGRIFYEKYKLDVITLRLFNIIGPYQNKDIGMVVSRFIHAAKHNVPLQVFGDGSQERSFCHVRDLIGFLDSLIWNKVASGQIINLGNDKPISILKLAQLIIELTNTQSKIEFVSYDDAYHEHYEYTYHRQPDLSLLYSLSNYRHQWSLEESLKDLIYHAL
jgi:UDP-glucose 4-epimerase